MTTHLTAFAARLTRRAGFGLLAGAALPVFGGGAAGSGQEE